MAFDSSRMLVNKVPREVTLKVQLRCTVCNQVLDPTGQCTRHDGKVEPIEIQVVDMSWARLNQVRAQCAVFNSKTNSSHFDVQTYNNTCLQEMIVEAPWGETNTMFLLQVGNELGSALEKIVPALSEDEDLESEVDNPEEIKKV